jgi:hypothetical protein
MVSRAFVKGKESDRDQVRKRSNPRIVAILYADPGRSLSENQVFLTGPSTAAKPALQGVFRTGCQQGWILSIQIKCQIILSVVWQSAEGLMVRSLQCRSDLVTRSVWLWRGLMIRTAVCRSLPDAFLGRVVAKGL